MGEKGVSRAARHCFALHFNNIIAATPAPLLVIVGGQARDRLKQTGFRLRAEFGVRGKMGVDEDVNLAIRLIGGRERVVAFLTHPAAFGGNKTFADMYPVHIDDLRAVVAGFATPAQFPSFDRG
jgi:hypothetical protein